MQPYYYLVIVCIIIIAYNYLAWVKLECCKFKKPPLFGFSVVTAEHCLPTEFHQNLLFIGC